MTRIHGARQQRETLKRTPIEQLKPIFEVSASLIPNANKGIVDVLHNCLFMLLGIGYPWKHQMESEQESSKCY